MLVNMKDLLLQAQNENYAVGSFSIANMEMVRGVIAAAEPHLESLACPPHSC